MSNLTGMMSLWIRSVPVADAGKAEGASTITLRIPRPPSFTGRVACVYWMSFILMLMTSVMYFRCICQTSEVEGYHYTLMLETCKVAVER